MEEQIKLLTKNFPIIKQLSWIIPVGIAVFAGISIYRLMLETRLNKQRLYINNYMLEEYMREYPDSEITKKLLKK